MCGPNKAFYLTLTKTEAQTCAADILSCHLTSLIICMILKAIGYKQPLTPIQTYTATVQGLISSKIQRNMTTATANINVQ